MRALLFALAALLVAGCSHGAGNDEARPLPRAEEPPAAAPGPPRPLLGEACAAELDAGSARVARLDAEIAAGRAEHEAARRRIAASQARIREGERDAAQARAAVDDARAAAEAAGAELRAFRAAYPGDTLPYDVYARWEELRDAYEAAQAVFEERRAAYNGLVARQNALVDDHNGAVDAHNAATERLNARLEERNAADRETREALERCADATRELPEDQAAHLAALEGLLAEPASAIAGREATVHCSGSDGWPGRDGDERVLGYVREGEPRIHLAPEVCHALHAQLALLPPADLACVRRAREEDRRLCPPREELLVRSIATVAHEALHVAGELDEARAECFGLQQTHRVGEALGLDPATARTLAWYAWRFPQVPEDYRSPECRAGGALDRRPPGATGWPAA